MHVEVASLQHACAAFDRITLTPTVLHSVLVQAFHELYAERKAMLANQPPQQQQPQQPQQVLQCPRMTAYVVYCQVQ
jgi:hypothetical protein